LFTIDPVLPIDSQPPERDYSMKITDGVDPSGINELGLGTRERQRVGVSSRSQHPDRRQRDLTLIQRAARLGHVF
jgi:hypothetical protein